MEDHPDQVLAAQSAAGCRLYSWCLSVNDNADGLADTDKIRRWVDQPDTHRETLGNPDPVQASRNARQAVGGCAFIGKNAGVEAVNDPVDMAAGHADQIDLGMLSRLRSSKLGFTEIPDSPPFFRIDDGEKGMACDGIFAGRDIERRHDPVAGRPYYRDPEIAFGQGQGRSRTGHSRFKRRDAAHGLPRAHCGLLCFVKGGLCGRDLGTRLVELLDRHEAVALQWCQTRQRALREIQARLRARNTAPARIGMRNLGFHLCSLDRKLGLEVMQLCERLVTSVLIWLLINDVEHLVAMDALIVAYRQFRDPTADVWRHVYDIGPQVSIIGTGTVVQAFCRQEREAAQ